VRGELARDRLDLMGELTLLGCSTRRAIERSANMLPRTRLIM